MSISIADRVAEILPRHDPIGIYFPEHQNADQYEPEARHIAQSLSACPSQEDCVDSVAGERDRYVSIAAEAWRLVRLPK